MYSNNMVNFQESTTILNAHTKKSLETYRMHLVYVYVCMCVCVCVCVSKREREREREREVEIWINQTLN